MPAWRGAGKRAADLPPGAIMLGLGSNTGEKDDPMASAPQTVETEWPLRTWVLAILAALFALAIQQLGALQDDGSEWGPRLVAAAIVFLGSSGLAFGLAWRRGRLTGAIAIALICGLIGGGVLLWNGTPEGLFKGSDGWHLFCGLIASGFLLTLFQAAQSWGAGLPVRWSPSGLNDWRREAIHYADVHDQLWTNVLTVGLSVAFAGLALGLAHLLAEMFWLVKLGFLRELLRKDWFNALLLGAAFGGAIGMLRDRGAIISLLQRVAMIVLRVLAPVLAVGVLIFLVALPFTGLAPLWDTGGTTPIMLVGAMLALFLANAVVSDTPKDESRSIVLSSSAAALGLFLVPMVGIAAFSSGLRIQQYGLSPDRLWALIFIVVASITAIAYAVAILGTRGWFARLRRTNLHLVYVLCGITLLLSTPLVSIERIATAHQLARLAGGQVSAEAFDYRGLWFDFGPPGRAAIERLAAHSSDARIKSYAAAVRKLESRWDDPPNAGAAETGVALEKRLAMLPAPFPLDKAMRARLTRYDACNTYTGVPCIVRYVPGQDYMLVHTGPSPKCDRCKGQISLITRDAKGGWSDDSLYVGRDDEIDAQVAAIREGRVEMRPVQQRQLFLDDKAVGNPMALAPEAVSPAPGNTPKR
jgi:hypothetical protein